MEYALYVIFGIVGAIVGYLVRKVIGEAKITSAEAEAERILQEASRDADTKQREILLEARDAAQKIRDEVDKEVRERRQEVQRLERRLISKEESLDRRQEMLTQREESLSKREKELLEKEKLLEKMQEECMQELERISGLSTEEAQDLILQEVRETLKEETARIIRDAQAEAKEKADEEARNIIALAIQRCAADHVAENTVSVVELPSEEMKGRIIGREGRNIRTLETLTGIELIIDDTPEAVILSGFDPVRREVARLALERLVADGRIHPARIEEMVEKAEKDVATMIKQEGERAALQLGIHNLHPELIKLLGRLKFRTSYGQNVLQHSIEVAQLAANMAAEIGANVNVAKRAGLLHDIGKAVDHEVEGSHVAIGVNLLKKYRESNEVIKAVEAHHGDVEPQSVEAFLVAAADAISAARPGARRETLEMYLKRLEKLEEIANSFEGVEKAYAIQAGREIRIMVKPEHIDDLGSVTLARDIAQRIEKELEYPGQIKVTVIRETRAVGFAK
ncbi:MAG TPA: ribonuclease Y [Bacillota bacterium]|nr:ribonuclease Y [Bacillota bacterium]HOK63818.1 ribonuclease Y [Bacillota bacterium]HOL11494.1 ribonuclease Y [Bacillota bacterium]HOQ02551.1 ribonuclease Y [Bacillota bacterium]HPP60365.1 ribonuclease Y [Bacillota bacterium]